MGDLAVGGAVKAAITLILKEPSGSFDAPV
jgi:hypothetical protein